jgi:molybdate transport system substrate-binding protein
MNHIAAGVRLNDAAAGCYPHGAIRHSRDPWLNIPMRIVRISKKITVTVAALLTLLRCYGAEIRVFAAASLTDAMKEVAGAYEKGSGDKVVFNFGASSMLARQIEEGAPADIFFSADEAKMDGLASKGLIEKGTRKDRLSNTLVIVVAAEQGAAVNSPKDLAASRIKRVALGDPRAVPIGIYAREYLEKLKLWEAVRPKVVATENVRAALAAVEAGNADASIVYKTDAAISKKVKVAFEVPMEDGPKIRYPMAMLKDSREPAAAKKFFEYLTSEEAGSVFERYCFLVIKPSKG